jgi:cation:H+ antiporter
MTLFTNCLTVLLLFCLLGFIANLVVKNIKRLAFIFKLRLFVIGSLLGAVTSFPELSVAINASVNNVSGIALGNLLGGIVFVFGFILAIGLILNGKVNTDGKFRNIIPQAIVLFFPVILGLDGEYGFSDGLVMVGIYLATIFYISRVDSQYMGETRRNSVKHYSTTKVILLSIIGLFLMLFISSLIFKVTIDLLKQFHISELMLGTILFSIGTNLPEITIVIISWYKKIPELSLSHLIGSAMVNVPILGGMAIIKPIYFVPDYSFRILGGFLGVILALFIVFYLSDKKLKRREGLILLGVYILFSVINFIIVQSQFMHNSV